MKKTMEIISILLVLFMVNACATPKLTNRYKKAKFSELKKPEDVAKYVTIKVCSYPIATTIKPFKSIFDLSDHGQQALIGALAEKEKEADNYLSKLTKSFEINKDSINNKDFLEFTKFSRKLVFSIKNETNIPANRIDSIELRLKLKEPVKVKFSSWDKIVTNYQNIDIGKLTLGQTTSFTLSPEFSQPTVSGKIGSLSYGRSLQEEVNIKDRLVTSGTLADNQIILFEKGVPGMDLSGNLIADVELEFSTEVNTELLQKFDNLFDEKGDPQTDSKIKIISTYAKLPNCTTDIQGILEYDFVFREVKSGQKTPSESDDKVVFQQGHFDEKNNPFILLPNEDLRFPIWRIWDGKNLLHIILEGQNDPTILQFSTYSDAYDLLKWLKSKKSDTIKKNKFIIGDDKNTQETINFDQLKVCHR